MAIYVDEARWPYRSKLYCHMMTDGPIQELHGFAVRLGLKRAWFQKKASGDHYDVSEGKRWQAIRMGAISVTSKELLMRCSPRLREIIDD